MAKKKAENANRFPKATEKDFNVIVKPLINRTQVVEAAPVEAPVEEAPAAEAPATEAAE